MKKKLQPGEFLLIVPQIRLREIYCGYKFAVAEADDFKKAGHTPLILNYKKRVIYGL